MSSEKKSIAPEQLMAAGRVEEQSTPPEEVPLPKEVLPIGVGNASRIDLDYILGSASHCFWAVVGGISCYKWMNADEIKTIVQPAFSAPVVSIQYNSSSKQIERIRPIKTF